MPVDTACIDVDYLDAVWGKVQGYVERALKHSDGELDASQVRLLLTQRDPRQRLGDDDNGLLLVGEKGFITCDGWSGMPRLLPLELHRAYERPPKALPRVEGHHADWLRACKGGPPACSSFDYGAPLCELTLLGNVALRAGKRLTWDAAGMRATNAPEADRFLHDTYRPGWELPA